MNDPTNQATTGIEKRHAFRIAIVFLLANISVTSIFFIWAFQTQAWQLYATAYGSVVFTLLNLVKGGINLRFNTACNRQATEGLIVARLVVQLEKLVKMT